MPVPGVQDRVCVPDGPAPHRPAQDAEQPPHDPSDLGEPTTQVGPQEALHGRDVETPEQVWEAYEPVPGVQERDWVPETLPQVREPQ